EFWRPDRAIRLLGQPLRAPFARNARRAIAQRAREQQAEARRHAVAYVDAETLHHPVDIRGCGVTWAARRAHRESPTRPGQPIRTHLGPRVVDLAKKKRSRGWRMGAGEPYCPPYSVV